MRTVVVDAVVAGVGVVVDVVDGVGVVVELGMPGVVDV